MAIALRVRFVLFFLLLAASSLLHPVPSRAQLQQPFVYTSGGGIAIRNDSTGALTLAPVSPLAPLSFPVAIDAKGRFLFSADNNSVRMYQVDAATGAYTEVPNSPFSSATTKNPILVATEPTGKFIGVVNASGINSGESSVETFQIDPVAQTLVPVPGSFLELVSSPVGAAASPKLGKFFVFLGPNSSATNPNYLQDAELLTYTIDPQTGLLGTQTGASGSTNIGRAFGAEPQGRFVVTAQGRFSGIVTVIDAASASQATLELGTNNFASEIFAGPGEKFIYVTFFSGGVGVVHIFALDLATLALTESPFSPLPGFNSTGNFTADPTGPFVYQAIGLGEIRVLSADPLSGYLTDVAGSPFSAPGYGTPVALSVVPGPIQPASGPVATFAPTNLSLGSIAVATPSNPGTVTLSSTGDQSLSLNAISVAGANAAEFIASDNCQAPTVMAQGTSCQISIIFIPAAEGARQALLTFTDNATGSPQTVSLSGIGLAAPAPAPAVTLVPSVLNFPSISQGSTTAPMSVTVTNSGNATLSISSILLSGNNPADFSNPTGNCIAASLAPGASCLITVAFTPLAAGFRQAALIVADNAPASPQSIALLGSGIAVPVSGPIVKFAPAAISFPVITQGLVSTPTNFVVSNTGTSSLHIGAITASGNFGDFVNDPSSCAGATVAPNATCSIAVSFAPMFPGQRAETLSIADDAPNSPQTLAVFATADPALTLSSSAAALVASVTAGQSAQYNLQFTPGPGFSGTVSLVCSGAPLAAICKAPLSVAINAGAPATFTVTVSTTGASIVAPPHSNWRTAPPLPFRPLIFVLSCVLACVLLLPALPLLLHAKMALPRRAAMWPYATVALFLLLLCTVAGCGGGSTSPPPPGPSVITPKGTSILTLTPSVKSTGGKSLQASPIQLTLTVN